MAKATQKQVHAWILLVMSRQAANMSATEAETQAKLSRAAFAARFPADCFCAASVDHVCATERYWNEAKVTQALEAWQSANAPRSTMPPEAENAPVSNEAKHWLAHWFRAETDPAADRALDLIRTRSDEAFGYLMVHDHRAASVAVWKHWPVPRTPIELAAEWDDEDGIRRLARRIATEAPARGQGTNGFSYRSFLLETLARTVKLHAPQHGPAMFEELRWIAAGGAAVPVEAERAPPVDIELGMFGTP